LKNHNIPKKTAGIRIVNPETHAEIMIPPKITSAKVPERSPSPTLKAVPVKSITPRMHSPAPSVDVERPSSGMGKSNKEIAEEMKAQLLKKLEDDKIAQDKAEAE